MDTDFLDLVIAIDADGRESRLPLEEGSVIESLKLEIASLREQNRELRAELWTLKERKP
jgi:hypothetical protein